MDPGRQALASGYKESRRGKKEPEITSPRRDSYNRVSKPRPSSRLKAGHGRASVSSSLTAAPKYLTVDQQSAKFVAEEDSFVLKQSKKKADIRVREMRAKPIDFLAFHLRYIDPDRDVFDDNEKDLEIDFPPPEVVLEEMNEVQLQELEAEIKSFHTLENNARNREFWEALLFLVADRLQTLKKHGAEGRAVNSVASEVDRILSPKTFEQLAALEKQIRAKLQSDEPIDTDYWEELLKSLLVFKAKAKLTRIGEAVKEARLQLLKAYDPGLANMLQTTGRLIARPNRPNRHSQRPPFRNAGKPSAVKFGTTAAPATQLTSVSSTAPPPGTARFASTAHEDFSQATKALYDREVARGIGEDEELFAAEEAIPPSLTHPPKCDQQPPTTHKYRPRKPRYFNRVQMGYEWNKYNQTHYDHDNPPPKVVQGYKFNIFYPDLIDKTKAPSFKIIREGGRRRGESFAPAGQEDTCLIRFIAGPPYEDIAFRIVDREWDYSAKKERGFKSSFDKGILQLHFQFKKIYYRK